MTRRNRLLAGLLLSGSIFLAAACLWLSCTQKSPIDPTASLRGNVPLFSNLEASPTQIGMGGAQSIIRVRLIDFEGNALVNETIQFSTSLGTIQGQAVTNSSGWAQSVLTSGQEIGEATITARYSDALSGQITVKIISASEAKIQIHTGRNSILASGIDTTMVLVSLFSDSADLEEDRIVSLSVSSGSIVNSVVIPAENYYGLAYLTSSASENDTTAYIQAVYGENQAMYAIEYRGINFSVNASPLSILADGKETSTVQAILKESTSHIGIPEAEIRFGSNLGSIPSSSETDISGVATELLTSDIVGGNATVVARYGNTFLDTITVQFIESEYSFEISTSPTSLLANGVDESAISVLVEGQTGQPVSNVPVSFQTSIGELDTLEFTNNQGIATTMLKSIVSTADQEALITVTVDGVSKNITFLFKGLDFHVYADPSYIEADGETQSLITAVLKETESRIGVEGAEIHFGSSLGSIISKASTNNQGVVQTYLTSGTVIGMDTVVVFYGETLYDTVYVQFGTAIPPNILNITSSPSSILASGIHQSSIVVSLVDDESKPVAGYPVSFNASSGTILSQGLTDDYGIVTVPLTSVASSTDLISAVTAQIGTEEDSIQVPFLGVDLDMEISLKQIRADGKSTSSIKAILKQSTSQVAIPGEVIRFGTDLGTIPQEAVTNANGEAVVSLTSGITSGTATITVYYGDLFIISDTVTFEESIPASITLSATPKVIPADNQSQSILTAVVTDALGNPVPDGTEVVFSKLEGSGTLEAQKVTNSGIATSYLTSGSTPDTVKIVARAGTVVSDTVTIVFKVGTPSNIDLSASPNTIPADGVTKSTIRATVTDILGNPVSGETVSFSATVGNIVESARTDQNGVAEVEYSSTEVGLVTISASVGVGPSSIQSITTIEVLPGSSFSIELSYDPHFVYVRDCGKNQTLTIYADVKDEKNNPVADGTYVMFSIFASPGQGDSLSSVEPIPTVNGQALVSYTAGRRSGTARIKAQVTDGDGNPVLPEVIGISDEIVVFSGPAYIENIYDPSSSHLTVTTERSNIWSWIDTTLITILVGDKYNNPVQEGTAVYLSTSGGVITTKAYTDSNGIANVVLESGNPLPTIDRFYNYVGLEDPNTGEVIPGPIPDFEGGITPNSESGYGENDGITRVIAYTDGLDENNQSAKPWAITGVVFSRAIPGSENVSTGPRFTSTSSEDSLWPGEYAEIIISLWDINGNPIIGGSLLEVNSEPTSISVELSWSTLNTGDPGSCYYYLYIYNMIDPTKEDDRPGWARVRIQVTSDNGSGIIYSDPIYMAKF